MKSPYSHRQVLNAFARKVDKRSHNECWNWKGSRLKSGHGQFKFDQGTRAHRFAWQLFFGPIPEGKMILHKCNNPGCVNPYHLYPGDGSDNMKDRTKDGYVHKEHIAKTLYENMRHCGS